MVGWSHVSHDNKRVLLFKQNRTNASVWITNIVAIDSIHNFIYSVWILLAQPDLSMILSGEEKRKKFLRSHVLTWASANVCQSLCARLDTKDIMYYSMKFKQRNPHFPSPFFFRMSLCYALSLYYVSPSLSIFSLPHCYSPLSLSLFISLARSLSLSLSLSLSISISPHPIYPPGMKSQWPISLEGHSSEEKSENMVCPCLSM